jgi:hypothetical protein
MVYWARLRTSRCLTAILLLKSPESLENPQTPEFPQACKQPNEFEFMSPCKANERKLPGGVGRGTKPTFLECKPRRRIQGPGLTGRASDTLCRQAILDKRPKVIGTESLPASGVLDDNSVRFLRRLARDMFPPLRSTFRPYIERGKKPMKGKGSRAHTFTYVSIFP